MRLHRLEVQAFGPFAGRVEVDVDALSAHGLFLLQGPTGSGKTSLLDAVCFALYGAVPGDRSTAGRLRSDHAPTDLPPEVVCELSVGSRRFEVTRSPAWERPKKKGTGATTQQASVLLRELVHGAWVARANRIDDAGLLLSTVLGMGLSQFTKVVLLPQGDFAAFLRAGADDRKRLLEKLFGTETFTQVEEWLSTRRRETADELREAREETARLEARVQQASASLPALCDALAPEDGDVDLLDLAALTDPDPADATPLDLAEARLQRAEHLLDLARRAESSARTGQRTLRERHEKEVARHERWTRYVDARQEHEALSRRSREIDGWRARTGSARAAAALRGHLDQLDAVESERSVALAGVTTAAEAVTSLGLDEVGTALTSPEPGPRTVAALRSAVSARREQLGRLADLVPLESSHAGHRAERDRVGAALHDLEDQLAAHAEAAATRATRRDGLAARRASLAAVVAQAPAADADLARAVSAADAATRATDLQARVTTAQALHLERNRHCLDLRAAHLDLLQRRLEGMAVELAASLSEGAACPVCGGTEHPSPARHHPAPGADAGVVSVDADQVADADQVTEAARAAEDAGTAADLAATEVTRLTAELAAARVASAGLSPDDAEAEVERLRRVADEADLASEQLDRLDTEVAALDAGEAEASAETATLTEQRDRTRHVLADLTAQLGAVEQRLAAARHGEASVTLRHGHMVGEIAALEHLTAAVDALTPVTRSLRAVRAAARSAAAEAGFDTLDTARAAALDADEVRALETEVATHERRLAAVVSRLAEPDLAQVAEELREAADVAGGTDRTDDTDDGPALPDLVASAERLAPARIAEARAEQRLETAAAHVTTAAAAVRDLTGLVSRVRDQLKATQPLDDRYVVLDDLTSCVLGTGGGNARRMRLSAYVLAARLEQVAEAATARLTAMSEGRYALQHTDQRSRGGSRSGLGLRVVDHWTNQVRETGSLSGGETFLASLALALGLADVVQAESGGLSIETLFVDEGFGSLDEETLDQVMTTLDGLREGGRAVGLVSHLSELKQRIPAQLQVVKTPTGSTLLPVGG